MNNANCTKVYRNGKGQVYAKLTNSGFLVKYEKKQHRIKHFKQFKDGHAIPVEAVRDAADRKAKALVIVEDSGVLRWVIGMKELLLCETRTLAEEEKFMIPQSKCKFVDRGGREVPSPQEQERRCSQRKQPPAGSPQRALFDDTPASRWGYER